MSHLHIPDGILPVWLWVLGYVLVGIYFLVVFTYLKLKLNPKKIVITSVFGALMLLSMSIPIPFVLPYHLNLSAILGILAGPLYAGLAIFSVNLIIALVGHGGITIVGLNTVILTLEAALAFLLFRLVRKNFKKIFPAVFISTFAALVFSTFLTVGVVYTGTQNLDDLADKHKHECPCSFHKEKQHETEDHGHKPESFDIKRFIALILITGGFGWTLEAFISGFIISYINRVKPDLLKNTEN